MSLSLHLEHVAVDGHRSVRARFDHPLRAASTSLVGGGLGEREWWLNLTVDQHYNHNDPVAHLESIATKLGLDGRGVAMMTAVSVDEVVSIDVDGVVTAGTVGVGWPTWSADAPDAPNPFRVGTINLLVLVPVRLTDSALINAVVTATEAKAQALFERGIPGTGTASDAIALCCRTDGPAEMYGGPRSTWGARVARSVHRATHVGLDRDPRFARRPQQ